MVPGLQSAEGIRRPNRSQQREGFCVLPVRGFGMVVATRYGPISEAVRTRLVATRCLGEPRCRGPGTPTVGVLRPVRGR